jgi:poly-beta-1,6-N-acetyl-D-glucosamine synthase
MKGENISMSIIHAGRGVRPRVQGKGIAVGDENSGFAHFFARKYPSLSLRSSHMSWEQRRSSGLKKVILRPYKPYEHNGVAQLAPHADVPQQCKEREPAATDVEAMQQTAWPKIAVLIPAHNEAGSIGKAAVSVLTQSVCRLPHVVVDVLVIADNCTDETEHIVMELQRQWPNLYLTKTVGNNYRKAGALNHGFKFFSNRGYTHTFTMDADTVLDPSIIEHGLKGMKEQDGGLCCRVGLLPLETESFEARPFTGTLLSPQFLGWLLSMCWAVLGWLLHGFWTQLWWALQNIEYAIAQSETVERFGWAHCLCGPGTLFRTSVLEQIREKTGGQIWPHESIVEDFALTKQIQLLGYATRVGLNMFAYTDVPIGFLPHWRQRLRWYSGDVTTWFKVGLNRYTMYDSPDMGFQLLWFSCRIALILTVLHIIWTGFMYIGQTPYWLLLLPVFTTVLNLIRFRYVPYKTVFQLLLLLCLVYELYALWYGLILLGSFYQAYTRRLRSW